MKISALALTILALVFATTGYAQMGSSGHSAHPGKDVYQKANCIGCHKWHGGGGGGYGGAALSLRETMLDAAGLKLTVRCGRPATGMPYHDRSAYQGDDTSCYGLTKEDLGEDLPPRARSFLREPQIDEVVDYVLTHLKGKGAPTKEECVEFWGEGSKECQSM